MQMCTLYQVTREKILNQNSQLLHWKNLRHARFILLHQQCSHSQHATHPRNELFWGFNTLFSNNTRKHVYWPYARRNVYGWSAIAGLNWPSEVFALHGWILTYSRYVQRNSIGDTVDGLTIMEGLLRHTFASYSSGRIKAVFTALRSTTDVHWYETKQ